MLGIDSARILCPYCNEAQDVVLDASVDRQEYIEDCQVCCRPIMFRVQVEPDRVDVTVLSDTDY